MQRRDCAGREVLLGLWGGAVKPLPAGAADAIHKGDKLLRGFPLECHGAVLNSGCAVVIGV